jgi:hypothetical protein
MSRRELDLFPAAKAGPARRIELKRPRAWELQPVLAPRCCQAATQVRWPRSLPEQVVAA